MYWPKQSIPQPLLWQFCKHWPMEWFLKTHIFSIKKFLRMDRKYFPIPFIEWVHSRWYLQTLEKITGCLNQYFMSAPIYWCWDGSNFSGHVIHYGLFLRDTLRDEPTESLDDIVFYMKSFIALLELASALFVICAGVKDGWIGNWSGNKCRKPYTFKNIIRSIGFGRICK